MSSVLGDVNAALAATRKEWGWLLALGIAQIVLGVFAIIYEGTATLASVFALGAIILIAGIVQIVAAFRTRNAGHVILYLLLGALEIIVGFMLIQHPVLGALTVTLILAVYLVFTGIFRTFYALWAQFPHYGWAIFSGVVALLLGILLWAQWPTTALWFLGFAVGVSFIFAGISWSMLALRLKSAAPV